MRQIKFRGKRVDNGEWVYGNFAEFVNYLDGNTKPGIQVVNQVPSGFDRMIPAFETELVEVIPESVGQFTGLYDKNGKEIYEGDIVTANWYDFEEPNSTATGEVIYCEATCAYCIWDEEDKVMTDIDGHGCYAWDIEVIGSAFKDGDLLDSQ